MTYLTAYTLIAGEPIGHRDVVVALVKEILHALGVAPLSLWWTRLRGPMARERAFRWERFLEVVDSGEAVAVTAWGIKRSKTYFSLDVTLRHGSRASNLTHYAPPRLSFIVQMGERVPAQRAIAAGELLLPRSAAALPVLSGGITTFADADAASVEVSFIGRDSDKRPELVRRRWTIDQGYQGRLWKKARRIYWVTLLGPKLAAELGGAEAARAAGAAEVEEIAGALLVRAGGPLEEDDAPSFRARTAGLRAWLWPRSIQNPIDNPGEP